ncbi:uncharacterized protein LOC126676708 [Mercurialis annua]|uniref:uncharacterized protein LOC126676708 n=1 Tax=Mercurialis annua TaxID=3986 RepID=UPI002160BC87|nr:uncharacterized protein LOC126676708 [Mercurialis annua]
MNTRTRAAAQQNAEADDAISMEVDQNEPEVHAGRGLAGRGPAGRGRAGRGRGGRGQAGRGRGRGVGRGAAGGAQAPGVAQPELGDFDFNTFLAGVAALQLNQVQLQAGQVALQDQYAVLGQIAQQQQPQAGGAVVGGVGTTDRDLVLAYMRLKPTEFDGSGDALDFLEEVEQNARRLQATERQTVVLVEMSMKGSAGNWFRSSVHADMATISWAQFVARFRAFFLPFSVTEG